MAPCHSQPGATPQGHEVKKAPALKARFTSDTSSIIIRAAPQLLSKVALHIIFSTKNREPCLND
jgi:hypothetical protein